MASIDWKGGKHKSTQAVKAMLRHNDKKLREQHEHTNEHIKKDLTKYNSNLYGGSYEQREKKYDDRVSELETRKQTGKNAPVVGQGLSVPVPPKLMDNFYAHATTDFKIRADSTNDDVLHALNEIRQWSKDVTDLIRDFVGDENMISSDLHVDEFHEYYDPEKKSYVKSFAHIHIMTVPENPYSPGKMSGKAFSSRARMVELNNRVEEMTQRDYGITWNTGEKKKRGKSVEELKNASEREEIIVKAKAEAEMIKDDAKAEAEAIRGDAKAEAQSIIGRAESDAEAIKSDAKAEAQSIIGRAESDAEAIKSDAEAEAQRYLSEAQNRADSVFDETLEQREKEQYEAFLIRVSEALKAAGITDAIEYATAYEKAISAYNNYGIVEDEEDVKDLDSPTP